MKFLLVAVMALGLTSTAFADHCVNNVVVERVVVERRPQVRVEIVSPHRQVSFREVREVEIVKIVDKHGRVQVIERVVERDFQRNRVVRQRVIVERQVNRGGRNINIGLINIGR